MNAVVPPALADARIRKRLRGLKPAQAAQLRRAMQLLSAGDKLMGGQFLLELARTAPEHPEVLYCSGLRHAADAEWPQAVACFARAALLRPDDFATWVQLAAAQDHADAAVDAGTSLRAAAAHAADAQDWLSLSLECDRQGRIEDAFSAVQRALALAPQTPVALLQRARCATALGQGEQAAADARALIARRQLSARAWFALADLKTVPLSAAELEQLARTAESPPAGTAADERTMLWFALGKALEDAGRCDAAFAALCKANELASVSHPWDAAAFARDVEAIGAAFAAASAPATDGAGREVIFLVGLPRSGTTLVEQILASHSQVEGASELPYLGQVLAAESQRRQRPLAAWAASASTDDWRRLGQDYLRLSQHWRARRPVATDKLPENWLYAEAVLRMLPQARLIDCRRDALETCWSCFKQLFGPGMVHFTYGFESLASYWHAYDGFMRRCAAAHPNRVRMQHYEALVGDQEGQTRALLTFCGLPFEADCLAFHQAQRAIRTPSALQVRQPLGSASTPAARYGALLDPLRRALSAGGPGRSANGGNPAMISRP